MREHEMIGWHHQLNEHKFEQTPGDGEGQRRRACYSLWGRKESDMTEQLHNNKARSTSCVPQNITPSTFWPLCLRVCIPKSPPTLVIVHLFLF